MREEFHGGKKCIIGAGEDTIKQILDIFFPKAFIERQRAISGFVFPKTWKEYGEVYKKATIDLSMYTNEYPKAVAIRVQGRDHKGDIKSKKDSIQRKDMETAGVTVWDFPIRECPQIFAEKLSWEAIIEFCNVMQMEKVKFE